MEHRNPYLLLGVDYGTEADQARRSFARAARRVRRAGGGTTTVEDLNWALHQIQNPESDPFDSVTQFRVPANPEVFEPHGDGLFAPGPRPLARRTTTDEAAVEQVLGDLADEVGQLIAAAIPRLVGFDHGYRSSLGDPA
jgi:hypothetical protein